MANHIKCESLTKRFQGIKALDELDLELEITQPTGIVGPNGAGKSTLFAILCGFISPTSGKVRVLDQAPDSSFIKGKLSLLPQDTSMFKGVDVLTQLNATLNSQKQSYLAEGAVSAEVRMDRLDRALDILVRHAERISEAMNADFVCRPRQINMMTDVAGSIDCIKHNKKHLKRWMKSESRPSKFPLGLLGSRSKIEYQPKGVVGIIAPWNFPVAMVFEPLASILAAGNRAMIKPSEFTPQTANLLAEIIAEAFDPDEVTVITGGPDVGQAFSSLPFDHMIFTGATSIAKHIMAAAAKNLVPVTLELGG